LTQVKRLPRRHAHHGKAMDFEPSPRSAHWRSQLEAFTQRLLLPHNAHWQRCAVAGEVPAFMEDLKALARDEGLWNLCLPLLRDEDPGTRLSHLDYADLMQINGAHRSCPRPAEAGLP
jgi:acyl-CoA dehydrogenase